jgi:hypothetical protein
VFDVGPASPIKTAFKEELGKRIGDIVAAPAGEKLQRIRKNLVESFISECPQLPLAVPRVVRLSAK